MAKKTQFFFACGGKKKDKNSFSPRSIVKTLIKKFRLRRANKKTKNKHDPLKNRWKISNISPIFFQNHSYFCFQPLQLAFSRFWKFQIFSGNSPNLYENSTKTLPFDWNIDFLSAYRRPEVFTIHIFQILKNLIFFI